MPLLGFGVYQVRIRSQALGGRTAHATVCRIMTHGRRAPRRSKLATGAPIPRELSGRCADAE
jgi:hypothetical protein